MIAIECSFELASDQADHDQIGCHLPVGGCIITADSEQLYACACQKVKANEDPSGDIVVVLITTSKYAAVIAAGVAARACCVG